MDNYNVFRRMQNPNDTLVILGLSGLAVLAYQYRFTLFQAFNGQLQRIVSGREGEGDHAKAASKSETSLRGERGLGEWTPFKFNYPKIEPRSERVADIKQPEYRPYKEGPYHVTMGLKNMPWDDWIELDDQYERYQNIRKHRIDTRGDKAIRVLTDSYNPVVRGGALAAVELVHELSEYLTRRYPKDFWVLERYSDIKPMAESAGDLEMYNDWGWEGLPPIKTIYVKPLGTTHVLPLHVRDGEKAAERALEIAALLVQDDLALMLEGSDGRYFFQAGAIVVPGFWRLEDKIGLPLEEIHTSGQVPQYREKLEKSMARFFRKMAVDKAVVRNNYFIQKVNHNQDPSAIDPEELGWSTTTNGSEDEFAGAHSDTGDTMVEQVRLRTERQTLRRLGVSGAIVFTIRTYLVPITELGETSERLGKAIQGWPEDVKEYKGANRGGWYRLLVAYLSGPGPRD